MALDMATDALFDALERTSPMRPAIATFSCRDCSAAVPDDRDDVNRMCGACNRNLCDECRDRHDTSCGVDPADLLERD